MKRAGANRVTTHRHSQIDPIFHNLTSFLRKFMFGLLGDLNSSLTLGVGAMSPCAEVIRLGATDFGAKVSGHALQEILSGVDVTGTSTPEYMTSSSVTCIRTRCAQSHLCPQRSEAQRHAAGNRQTGWQRQSAVNSGLAHALASSTSGCSILSGLP